MPFETPSLPVLIKRTQSDLAGDSLRQSDAQVLARTLGGAAYGLYGYLDWIAEQILPDKADESTLERIAALRLNQPRKPAQVATGSVSFTATAGAVLDVDTLLQASDGRTYKVTAARTTVSGSNTTTIATTSTTSKSKNTFSSIINIFLFFFIIISDFNQYFIFIHPIFIQ